MALLRAYRRLSARLTLTQRVALTSLVPMVVLGFVLTSVLEQQVERHSVADAGQSARLIASIGIQPRLTPREVRNGLTAGQIQGLDDQLRARSVTENLARIKIWNAAHTVVYSDDHALIGRSFHEAGDLNEALDGHASTGEVMTPKRNTETASEVGLGELVEVYVPLRFAGGGAPAGAFEIYLSYKPIAAAIAHDKRVIVLVVAIGLALLWAVLFRIVATASTRLRRQARENNLLARYDPLTGLPNRTLFRERVDHELRRAEPGRRAEIAVLLIDIDGFAEINNTLGSSTGDEVLRETGRRFQGQLGEQGLIARIGADEYAILCPHAEGVPGALRTAAAVQASMVAPIVIDDVALNVEVSIGLAVAGAGSETLDELLQHADAALSLARSRRTRIEVFSAELAGFDPERLKLLGQVRRALEQGEFELRFQPKVELAGRRVSGVEALLRWRHPELGLLMPAAFISLVEQTALIGPLTLQTIDTALAQMVRWHRAGIDLAVAVNLSARNLLDPDLPGQVAAALHRHGIPPARLTLEVTESATMLDPARAKEVLCSLRDSGVSISIDDFGSGNASIGYLSSLPADELKIDRSLASRVCEDEHTASIVGSIVDLARHLGLRVVAEGIETDEVMERLIALGCEIGQGYLIARPLSEQQLRSWLGSGRFAAKPRSDAPASRGAVVTAR
jgi:diguanylate cyclase (GGDEF)-like protein